MKSKILVASLAILFPFQAWAEEPANRFLDKMKSEGMYDLAARYIDIYGQNGWLPDSIKKDAPLEKLMILQDSLTAVKTIAKRDEKITEIENGLKAFLDAAKDHPRRSEARLRLGNVQLGKAQIELKKLDDPKEKANGDAIRKVARDLLVAGEAMFKSNLDELAPLLQQMEGANVAADDKEKTNLRNKYRNEYRQAQVAQGYAMKLIATTYPDGSNEYKDWLKKAEERLSDVISKATSSKETGVKMLSRLYRGDVQALQGQADKAVESYTAVADFDEDGIFRIWRVQAATSIIKLLASAKGGNKFEAAINRGEDLVKSMQREEAGKAEWLDLQLAIVEARLAYLASFKDKKPEESILRTQKKEAREMLTMISRRGGDHQAKAKKLLSEMGVDAKDPNEGQMPKVKDFNEAFKFAKERLDRSESIGVTIEILNGRLAEVSDAEKPAIQAEIKDVEAGAERDRSQAIQLFQQALKMYRSSDSRETLLNARFLLSFMLFRANRAWEAAAAGDFASRSGAGTDMGLKAGSVALAGYITILKDLPKEKQTGVIASLESLSKHMLATWPDAEETEKATLTLLDQALKNQDIAQAERYLGMLPSGSEQTQAIKRDLGYVLWAQYLGTVDAARKAGDAKSEGDKDLRERVERMLKEGFDSIKPTNIDQRGVEAGAALASLYLRTDRLALAEGVLNKPEIGPVAAIGKPDVVKEPTVRMEVLRLNLQTIVSTAATSSTALDPAKVQGIVKQMQETAASYPEGEKLMTTSLLILAKDLQDQLGRVEKPDDQKSLAGGIQILLKELADVSQDPALLDWAGTTMWNLAKGLDMKPGLADTSKSLYTGAVDVFSKMIESGTKDPKFLDPINRKTGDIMYKQSLAYQGMKDFEKSNATLLSILKANPNQITIQIEAARNFQLWSEGKNPDLLKKAIFGAEPDAKRTNTIWGWGQISKKLASSMAGRKDLEPFFYDARLQLASCRRLLALASPGNKNDLLEKAFGDIRQTLITSSELGGEELKKKFDDLTKTLQSDLGRQMIGLKEFEPKKAEEPKKPE